MPLQPYRSGNKLRVFICHAKADKPDARVLYDLLQLANVEPWLDEKSIPVGAIWEEEIPAAVKQSDLFVALLSRESVAKEGYIQKEIRFALDRAAECPEGAIFVAALRLEECDVPDRLGKFQFASQFEQVFDAMVARAVERRRDSPKDPTGTEEGRRLRRRLREIAGLNDMPPAVRALSEMLNSEDSSVRLTAIKSLAQMGSGARTAVPFLIEFFRKNPHERQVAVDALVQIGPEAILALTDLLEDIHWETRQAAALALGKTGPKTEAIIKGFIKLLEDENVGVRRTAAKAVAEMGPEGKAAISCFIELLKDDDEEIRIASVIALARMGPEAMAAIPAFIKLLRDRDENVRRAAAWAMGQIGPEAKAAVPDLIVLLKDEYEDVRSVVAGALGRMGSEAKEAIAALIEALKQGRTDAGRQAANALAKIGCEAVPGLIEVLKDKDLSVTAAETLGKMGSEAKAAIPALIELLNNHDENARCTAAWALGQIGPEAKAATRLLIQLLKNPFTQHKAAEALIQIGPEPGGVPAVVELLKDQDKQLRRIAARVIGQIGPEAKAAVQVLTELLEVEDWETQAAAAWALHKIKNEKTR